VRSRALPASKRRGRHASLFNLSAALKNAGRLAEAAEVMLQGLAMARELGLELTAGAALFVNAANQLFLLGRWQEEEEDLLRKAPRLERPLDSAPTCR
jgi:hypothetical protein